MIALILVHFSATAALDARKANEALLRGTSPFEDMIGFALSTNDARRTKALAAADARSASVKEALSSAAATEFESLVEAIHKAAKDKNHYAVAANAVEVFHLMIDNLQADILKIPKEVSLLDYAGFKLQVLAAAPHADWEAMRKIVANATTWWGAIKAKVTDKRLRDTVNSTVRGLEQAGKSENLPMLQFGAQIDLDLVDLLEAFFERK
jgi:hypothetical protein